MKLDMEVIELHKLTQIVKEKGGESLDFSTDAVCCAFQGESPFELIDGVNLKGYTYDGKSPKYKLESKGRLN
jgi:hypothetical protein